MLFRSPQFSRPEGAAGRSLGSVPVLAQCFSAECQYHSSSGLYARNAPGTKRLDIYLQADDLEVLKDAGKISAQLAKMHAETEFEKYRVVQDRLYQSDFDRYLEESAE